MGVGVRFCRLGRPQKSEELKVNSEDVRSVCFDREWREAAGLIVGNGLGRVAIRRDTTRTIGTRASIPARGW